MLSRFYLLSTFIGSIAQGSGYSAAPLVPIELYYERYIFCKITIMFFLVNDKCLLHKNLTANDPDARGVSILILILCVKYI